MKKTTLYLFMLIASFSWQRLSATEIPGANFKFSLSEDNGSNWMYPCMVNNQGNIIIPCTNNIDDFSSGGYYEAVFEIDLPNTNEGDQILIKNESTNVSYINCPSMSGTSNNGNPVPWDLLWYDNTLGAINTNSTTLNGAVWPQNSTKTLNIPSSGGFPISGGKVLHSLYIGPDYGCYGWDGIYNYTGQCPFKRLRINIIVNDLPNCIEDQTICPGETLDMNAINPNGYTASNWSPFNPTMDGVDETTTFTVTLTGTNALSNNCTFEVEVINPEIDFIDIDMLCAEDLPYSFNIGGIWTANTETIDITVTRTFGNSSVSTTAINHDDGILNSIYGDESELIFNLPGYYEINYTYLTYVNNVWITCSKTYELTIHKKPKVVLPEEISFCGNNFEPICIPNPPANYLFNWQNPLGAVYQSSSNPCFTPTHYGNHTLVVSNKFGCEYEYNINVLQGIGPKIYLNDVKYCKDSLNIPSLIGFNYSLINVQSYSWTFNGDPIVGINGAPNSPQIPFPFNDYDVNGNITELKDGNYCVTVTWNDGCQSKACFEVVECCEMPDASFQIYNNSVSYPAGTLTVINNPNSTSSYTQEVFTVYVWCPGIHTDWTYLTGISRNSNFNNPYVFTGLSSKCNYKVIHSIKSPCGKNSHIEETGNGSGPLPIIVYPNPPKKGMPVNIEMKSYADPAFVEITNLVTGKRIFNGTLEYNSPIRVDYSVFMKSKGASFGMYNVKVYNKTSVVNKKLIVR